MKRSSIVESIKNKVEKLINENIRLNKKCEEVQKRELKLKDMNRVLQEEVAALQKRVGVMELRGGITGGVSIEDKRLAKARVNQLMREIDKCIAMMNN